MNNLHIVPTQRTEREIDMLNDLALLRKGARQDHKLQLVMRECPMCNGTGCPACMHTGKV